jgi:ParB family chromosome partitioning protein
MGKLDQILQATGANIDESMGAGRKRVMHGATPPLAARVPDRLQGISRSRDAAEIPIEKIDRDPDQPREEFDPEGLAQLAESLRSRGQLQPIRVRWDEGRGVYVIVCGERRWRAARMAGLVTLSCIIVEKPLDAAERLAVQLVENALREDLRPIEQARAYRALMDLKGWSGNQLARELAIHQASVARALALLDPETVQEQVEQGALSPATAYEVSKVADVSQQQALAERVVAEKLSRDDVAREVRKAPKRVKATSKARKVTTWTRRTPAGCKVTVERGRGLDEPAIIEALEEALRLARQDQRGETAA